MGQRRPVMTLICLGLVVGSMQMAPQYWAIAETARAPVGVALDESGVYNGVSHSLSGKDPNFVAECSASQFAHKLSEQGFTRNPASKVTVVNGSRIDGSWVYRNSTVAPYQTHARLQNHENHVDVYVHREWNYLRYPVKHVRHPGEPDTTPDAETRFRQLTRGNTESQLFGTVREYVAKDVTCSIHGAPRHT